MASQFDFNSLEVQLESLGLSNVASDARRLSHDQQISNRLHDAWMQQSQSIQQDVHSRAKAIQDQANRSAPMHAIESGKPTKLPDSFANRNEIPEWVQILSDKVVREADDGQVFKMNLTDDGSKYCTCVAIGPFLDEFDGVVRKDILVTLYMDDQNPSIALRYRRLQGNWVAV